MQWYDASKVHSEIQVLLSGFLMKIISLHFLVSNHNYLRF